MPPGWSHDRQTVNPVAACSAASWVCVLPSLFFFGKTQAQLAAEQAATGFTVWRSWDQPGGIRDELYAVARNNPQLVKLEVLGHTYGGRELIALKVTQSANDVP